MFEQIKGYVKCPVTKEITKEAQVKELLKSGFVPICYIPKAELEPEHYLFQIEPNLIGMILGAV